MRDSHRCERCGSTYPQAGVLAGHCPRCLVELALDPAPALKDEEIVLKALADEARSMVGRRIAHYEVLSLLGAGGMGAVWKAKDTVLGRDVALKTLPPHFKWDAAGLSRLELEAKLLASLNHPNIAAIHGLQDDGGKRFLVLEFVEGETLADRLRRGAIPLEQSLQIARQISDALEAAHEKGIIHRDLKPANIQITENGTVKVLDFGLAKALAIDAIGSSSSAVEITDPQMVLGTTAYMAPEQARGQRLDRRADIWAFGVVFYEMLTGTRPFRGTGSAETIASILTQEADFEPVPIEVRRLIRKCLEKEPKNRLRDIGDAWELLNPPVVSTAASPQVERRRATLPWISAASLGIVSLVLSLLLLLKPTSLPEVSRFPIYAPPGSRLPVGTPAISDDGRMLAYTVVDSDQRFHLYSYALDTGEAKLLPGTQGGIHPFWSPDRRSLAFSSALGIKRLDLASGFVRELIGETSAQWQGSWSVDGTILARQGQNLVRTSADGKGVPQPVPESVSMTFPAFLSDGRSFLFRLRTPKGDSIQRASLDSTKRTDVVKDVISAPILAPTPGGKTYLFYLSESDLMAQEFDEASGRVRGNEFLFIPDIGRVGTPPVLPAISVSPRGHLAYQNSDAVIVQGLKWVNRKGETIRNLSPDASVKNPRLSPNEKWIAGPRNRGVWVTDLGRETSDRTFEGLVGKNVVWSPDGSKLAFPTPDGIYTVNSNGGNPKLLTKTRGMPTSWVGDYLAYTEPANFQHGKIYLINPANPGKPIQVGSHQGSSFTGALSPDGKYLAFGSAKSGRYEVYVQRLSGSGETRVSGAGGSLPRWRADGNELYFITLEGDLMAADIQRGDELSIGQPEKLFHLGSADGYEAFTKGYDVSKDGERFLIPLETDVLDAPINVVLNWWVELEKKTGR